MQFLALGRHDDVAAVQCLLNILNSCTFDHSQSVLVPARDSSRFSVQRQCRQRWELCAKQRHKNPPRSRRSSGTGTATIWSSHKLGGDECRDKTSNLFQDLRQDKRKSLKRSKYPSLFVLRLVLFLLFFLFCGTEHRRGGPQC